MDACWCYISNSLFSSWSGAYSGGGGKGAEDFHKRREKAEMKTGREKGLNNKNMPNMIFQNLSMERGWGGGGGVLGIYEFLKATGRGNLKYLKSTT